MFAVDGSWPPVMLDGRTQTGPQPAMKRLLGIEFEKLRSGEPLDLSDVHDLKEIWACCALLREFGGSAPTEADRTACFVIVQRLEPVVAGCMERHLIDPTPVIAGIDYPDDRLAKATWGRLEGKVLAYAGTTADAKPEPAFIVSHGGGYYSIGDGPQKQFTASEDSLINAFIGYPTMDTRSIRDATKDSVRPAQVLKQIAKKYDGMFAPAIDFPGRKGVGYTVRVRRAEST